MSTIENSYAQCRWLLRLDGCPDHDFFARIMIFSLITFSSLALLCIVLIFYRQYTNKGSLWSGHLFSPLDGLLFFAFIWSVLRNISSIIKLYNWLPDTTWRYVLFEASWSFATISVATYASGLFYAIPKMQFNQRTGASSRKLIWLPKTDLIPYFYWAFVIGNIVVFEILTIFAVKYMFMGDHKKENLIWGVHWFGYALCQTILAIVLIYYGQMLVSLARESINLTVYEAEKEKYKTFADRMRLTNISLTIGFGWYICALSAMSFAPDFIYSSEVISKVNAVVSEIWSGLCGIIVVAALLYSERTSSKKVSFEDLSSIWTLYNQDEERSMTEI